MSQEEGMNRLKALRGLVKARGEMYAFLSVPYLQPPLEGWVVKALEMDFLQEHLARWVPALCREICRNARSDFYRGVASLTREFVRVEAVTLKGVGHDL